MDPAPPSLGLPPPGAALLNSNNSNSNSNSNNNNAASASALVSTGEDRLLIRLPRDFIPWLRRSRLNENNNNNNNNNNNGNIVDLEYGLPHRGIGDGGNSIEMQQQGPPHIFQRNNNNNNNNNSNANSNNSVNVNTNSNNTTNNNAAVDSNATNSTNENAAANNTNNNNNNNNNENNINTPGIFWCDTSLPFLILGLLLFLYEHIHGLIVFIWLTIIIGSGNEMIKTQVALKGVRNSAVLLFLVWFLSMQAYYLLYFWFRKDHLWNYLVFKSIDRPMNTLWDILWVITVNDLLVRIGGMVVKIVLILVFGGKIKHRRLGQVLATAETALLLYRSALPMTAWAHFRMSDAAPPPAWVVTVFLTIKVFSLISRSKNFVLALKGMLTSELRFGRVATMEQVEATGSNECSICQSEFVSPVVLQCDHVFCEECVTEWFLRERTCPLCRCVIQYTGNRTFSDGSTPLGPIIF